MVTMYKIVYRDVYVDDMTEETREVNCAEFTTDKAHAYERLEVWSRNTGEFGFSLRRRIHGIVLEAKQDGKTIVDYDRDLAASWCCCTK